MMIKHSFRITALLSCLALSACAQSPTRQEQNMDLPQPQTIRLRANPDAPRPPRGMQDPTIEKDLFNIEASPKAIKVNGREVAGIPALERLFIKHPNPMITIAAHKCLSGAQAAKIMRLAQEHTDTPIPFGSYGELGDPECQ